MKILICLIIILTFNKSFSQKTLNFGEIRVELENHHTCEARVILDEKYALVIYSEVIEECNSKSILAIEKLISRDSTGKPHFNIIDTLEIKFRKGEMTAITNCVNEKKVYFVLVSDLSHEYFGKIINAWTYDKMNPTKLIEVNPKKLKCLNGNLMD